ncbi:unnamed protein product [Strongylus vulgaris]|uniref:Uncharacterized protein n=1 Tax=Strongylus vulgaris TaxID=40348 RepID=A0A3P7IR68_STRVU|nr:unnamed protein product [Strongylus vulgaris]
MNLHHTSANQDTYHCTISPLVLAAQVLRIVGGLMETTAHIFLLEAVSQIWKTGLSFLHPTRYSAIYVLNGHFEEKTQIGVKTIGALTFMILST